MSPHIKPTQQNTSVLVGAVATLSLGLGLLALSGVFTPGAVQTAQAQTTTTNTNALACERAFFARNPNPSPTPTPPVCTQRTPVDITFVIDHSSSMARRKIDMNCNGVRDAADGDRVEDLRQVKLEAVKQATKEVISGVFDVDTQNLVRVGVIKFATCDRMEQETGTRLLSPLVGKDSRAALLSSIDSLQIPINVNDWNTGSEYKTCTHEGLELAANQARMGNRSDARQVVILLTDGRPYHTSNPNDPRNRSVMERLSVESAVALALKNYGSNNSNGVKVITVGVGDPELPAGVKICGWDPLKDDLLTCQSGVYDQDGDGNFDNNYVIPTYDWDGFPTVGPTITTQCRPDRNRPGSTHLIIDPATDSKNVLNDVVKDVLEESCINQGATLNTRFTNTSTQL